MSFTAFKSSSGLQRKADATSAPDGSYTTCEGASFDEVGATTSARGRVRLNNDAALSGTGSVVGGFDGNIGGTKYRFIKQATKVFEGTVADGADILSGYATEVIEAGTLAPLFTGATAPTFGSGTLTGFTHGGYAYMADGSAMGRWLAGGGSNVKMQTWGLTSPGYHELTGTTPVATTSTSTTVTVTVTGGHGLGYGVAASPSYPYTMNLELVGMEGVGGVPAADINGLHDGRAATNADLAGSGTQATVAVATNAFTLTFQNKAGAYDWPKVDILSPSGSGHASLSGSALVVTRPTRGSSDPPVDCIQVITTGGTGTAGYFRVRVSNGAGTNYTTNDIAYNATNAQLFAAILALPFFSSGTNTRSVCSVTSATAFTFTIPTAATSSASGGGSIGFMRQGPTLTASAGTGHLTTGKYYWAYTFYNGVAESNFSAQVPASVTANDAMVLTNVLTGPRGTTERRIYRTDVNGRQIYYVGKISDNTTYTFTDTGGLAPGADTEATPGDSATDAEREHGTSDQLSRSDTAGKRGVMQQQSVAKAAQAKKQAQTPTNLGLLSDWTDHDPPPTNLKHVGLVGETCVGISGGDIVFSESTNVEHFPLSNRFTPNKNNATELKTWLPFDRDVIVYTTNSMHRLSSVGLDLSDARVEEIETPVGCAGEYAAAALDGLQGHLFLSKAGLYLFDGSRCSERSFSVEPLFTDPADDAYVSPWWMAQACMVMSRDRMFLAYRSALATSSGPNNRILFGDFQDIENPSFSVLSFEAVSLWREKADNKILSGDSDGNIYELDYGYTDNGGAITWSLVTKEYSLASGLSSRLDELILDANLGGAATTITVSTRLRGATRTATFTSSADGRQRLKFKTPVSLCGEVVKVAISSSAAAKRSLYSVGFTYRSMEEP